VLRNWGSTQVKIKTEWAAKLPAALRDNLSLTLPSKCINTTSNTSNNNYKNNNEMFNKSR